MKLIILSKLPPNTCQNLVGLALGNILLERNFVVDSGLSYGNDLSTNEFKTEVPVKNLFRWYD